MFRTTAKRALLVSISLALAWATQIPAQAAEPSAGPFISIDSPGGLAARGAGVGITVTTRCQAGTEAYIYANLTQIGPEGYPVHANGVATAACTGQRATVPLGLMAVDIFGSPYASPLQLGSAFVSATLEFCDEFTCGEIEATRGIKVTDVVIQKPNYSDAIIGLQLPKVGTIQGDGAGAVVLVPYRCNPNVQGFVQASLGEVTEDGIVALSSAGLGLSCTPQKQSGVLAFHALVSAWEPGTAFITLDGQVCDDSSGECAEPTAFRTLKLS